MKRFVVLSLVAAIVFGSAAGAMAQCQLAGFSQLPAYPNPPLPISLGPTMLYFASTYPDVANAIAAGRDAWNGTDAGYRIGGYGGTTGSDCPLNQPFQIGAYYFTSDPCATATAYGYNVPQAPARSTSPLSIISGGTALAVGRNRCRSTSKRLGQSTRDRVNTISKASSPTSSGTCSGWDTCAKTIRTA